MRRLLILGALASVAGCNVVDPGSLIGFECDDAGHCRVTTPPDGGPSLDGGPTTQADGGQLDAGGGRDDGGVPFDAGAVCAAGTCAGCCDVDNQCQSGDLARSCGINGAGCGVCSSGTSCQNHVCEPLKANGTFCDSNAACASAVCDDGVCCSGACSGSCESCALGGSVGLCSLRDEGAAVTACGSYACDGLNSACPTSCTSSRQCAAGRFCIRSTCQMLRANAESCTGDSQCVSGFCADGVCCDKACSNSCDRCNLAGKVGQCVASPTGDLGAPACGGSVVCNGTLTDCPILCGTGCPTGTYCSGTYCSAMKGNGVTCGAAAECVSRFCVGGKCCDAACSGACESCTTAGGASTDGQCSLLGSSRICRSASGTCDVAERCDGTRATCPEDAATEAGVTCATTDVGSWSACGYSATCSRIGSRSRSSTTHTCSGGACGSTPGTETDTTACMRNTQGNSCGANEPGAWSACSYPAACSASGSRTRSLVVYTCSAAGTCGSSSDFETDTAGCNRTVEGSTCGGPTTGAWSACSYSDACTNTGTRSRQVTTPTCTSGTCMDKVSTEMDSSGCSRNTNSTSCGTTMIGSYGACTYGTSCSTGGSRTRPVTIYACNAGSCQSDTNQETDTTGCGRATEDNTCGTTSYGTYSACSYGTACVNSGSRSRSVTSLRCTAGTCGPRAEAPDVDALSCNRDTSGAQCAATDYGAFGACSYADACINSGSRQRSTTTHVCAAGSCGSTAGAPDVDIAGCARNTAGVTCAPTEYGAYGACSYADFCATGGSRTRSTTLRQCGGGACGNVTGAPDTDTSGCGRATENLECVAPTCGPYTPSCNTDCERTRTCNHSLCRSAVCTPFSYEDSCRPPSCCLGCIPL